MKSIKEIVDSYKDNVRHHTDKPEYVIYESHFDNLVNELTSNAKQIFVVKVNVESMASLSKVKKLHHVGEQFKPLETETEKFIIYPSNVDDIYWLNPVDLPEEFLTQLKLKIENLIKEI